MRDRRTYHLAVDMEKATPKEVALKMLPAGLLGLSEREINWIARIYAIFSVLRCYGFAATDQLPVVHTKYLQPVDKEIVPAS